jgi:outer membrane protein OmpA-like peptidoglycan-associated protein
MDIWISEWLPEGNWSQPVNAGSSINTARDEMAPYVHGDGNSIYFSSSGWVGMGGFDLFVSKKTDDARWMSPINLGYPINTYGEEMGICFHSKSNFALFSSNRDSTNGRDILRFYLPDSLAPERVAIVSGKVINAVTNRPISALVLVQNQEGELISRVESDPRTGNYMIGLPVDKDHRFVVNREGFLFYSAYLPSDSLLPGKSFECNILLEPLRLGSKVVLRNVFFDTDSYTIKKESFPELLELLELLSNNRNTNIEIGGHTDNTGDYQYNVTLSKNRAEAVRQFLVSKGVNTDRLTSAGYGPDQPISDNDTAKSRAENRRTEIKITNSTVPEP